MPIKFFYSICLSWMTYSCFASFYPSIPKDSLQHLPSYIWFTENKGQWDADILFESKFYGGNAFLKSNEITYLFYPKEGLKELYHKKHLDSNFDTSLTYHAVKMKFLNANPQPIISKIDSNLFYENYFIGKDQKHWASYVKSYKQIIYNQLYNHIDLKTLSSKNNFRYDFILHPGANINDVDILWEGQDELKIKDGRLFIKTAVGEVYQTAPYAYQVINGRKKSIACQYILEKFILKFKITEPYDKSIDLIIDPTLVFATYTGSLSDNFGMTATYDNAGNAYTAGICFGNHYPTTIGAFQITFAGLGGITSQGTDISISKFNPSGSTLLYSTYLGGSGYEGPESIVVDNANELVVFGRTSSINFPMTVGAFQTTKSGGYDFIITKFNTTGTALVASTYLGGTLNDGVNGIPYNYEDGLRGSVITDPNNNIYIGGNTLSPDFPVTAGCVQSTLNGLQDAIVAKFNPQLTIPYYITYLGGINRDAVYSITLNSNNQLYACGATNSPDFPTTPSAIFPNALGAFDGFVCLFANNGNSLVSSTYIGTSNYNEAFFIQTDAQNKVYIYGQTEGAYPVTAGVYSNPNSGQFIHCLNQNLSSTYFSTVVGTGSGFPDIVPSAFLVDVCGSIYIAGWGGDLFGNNNAHSTTFGLPTTANAFMQTTDGNDFYFLVLNKDALSLQYATYFGGSLSLEHVDGGTSRFDKSGVIYQAICESCGGNDDMPSTPNAYSTVNGSPNCNNAVVKFSFSPNLTVAQLAIAPANPQGCVPFTVTFTNNSINGIDYMWNFGDGNSSTTNAPIHTYTTAGVYQVQLISHNAATCNIYDTTYTTITVFPPLVLNPMPTINICLGDSVSLNQPAPTGCTYTWSPSNLVSNPFIQNPKVAPIVDTKFLVTVNRSGCIVSDSVNVFVFKNNTKIVIDANHACLSDTVKLSANQPCTSYTWSNGQSTNNINITTPGWFYLTTQSTQGCIAKDSVHIDSLLKIPVGNHSYYICQNQSLQLLVPSGYTYKWIPNYEINNTQIFDPMVSPKITTIYTLTIINGPCQSEGTYFIKVYPLPTQTLTPKSIEVFSGDPVFITSLSDTISNWEPPTYLSCTFCNQPISIPDNNIIYYSTVKNKFGCMSKDSVVIKVVPTLYIPNCFTPNDDNLNDVFKPEYAGYTDIELLIFDRWGEQIFKTTELHSGWNGKRKDTPCQIGVYTYKLTATDYNKKTIEKIGHVTLLR
jgi:gliding motility-associated-like protein